MRDYILLYINGQRTEVRGPAVFAPVSSHLRYGLAKTGTKVVCAEGDCGACAVLKGSLKETDIAYKPVTSCVIYLFQLDCAHIITVEGLGDQSALNPVQSAMAANNGAQCGYCTPGFVVSMSALLEHKPSPTESDFRQALVGNLCRCTGYDAIIKSGMSCDTAKFKKMAQLYPPGAMVADFLKHGSEEVLVKWEGKRFFKPTTVESAVRFRAENPGSMIIAGGTDLGVMMNKGLRDPRDIMSVSSITAMDGIVDEGTRIVAKANATLDDLERFTAGNYPALYEMLVRHGSPLIRNSGTLAGNIANGSPIGDAMPLLFVVNGEVQLTGIKGSRWVNMNQFYTGYRKTVMTLDELITAVAIPKVGANQVLRFYKVSKRHDMDISTFGAAIWAEIEGYGIKSARVALGGVGPVVLRLPKAETALAGRPLTEASFKAAGEIARSEVSPISDVRGSADYRSQLVENIFLKFFFDVTASMTAGSVI